MPKNRIALVALCVALAPQAWAQKAEAPAKKLYCWDDRGQRVCSDALPAEAVNRARQEINAKSGMRTAEVGRALTEEERAIAASDDVQRRVDQAAAETRRRTDQAMLLSYPNEQELGRVFTERTNIVDNSIRTSRFNVTSLREGLVTLLQMAGNRELSGQPVAPDMADNIRRRHVELLRQRRMQSSFERQRQELDLEVADIMQRYRQMKGIDTPSSPAPADAAGGSGQR